MKMPNKTENRERTNKKRMQIEKGSKSAIDGYTKKIARARARAHWIGLLTVGQFAVQRPQDRAL